MFRVFKLNYKIMSIQPHVRAIRSTGIEPERVIFNPSIPTIYKDTFLQQKPSDPFTQMPFVSSTGALCAYSGKNTQRKSKNSRLVMDSITKKTVNWNQTNLSIEEPTYDLIERIAIDYLNHKPKIFVVDGYLGWDPKQRLKVRSFVTLAYHALFLKNILVKPTKEEVQKDFSLGIDITLFNGGELSVSKNAVGTQDEMITAINPSQQRITILGTQFAGEMKKSLLKMSSYMLPRKGLLTLRGSAFTVANNDVTLLIGLPGAGKGSLPLHAQKQNIIAIDQLVWNHDGLYNMEGGIYARILNLRSKLDNQVHRSLKFGTLVENANHLPSTRDINFNDVSVSENARICYPLENLSLFKKPPISGHPKNVIILTCDLQGVLPPVARLTKQQAIFYYLTGYTAMLNNKQIKPKRAFSTCLTGGCTPLIPNIYAQIFKQRIQKHQPKLWLVNTGWTKGRQGFGKRITSKDSTRIINAINNNQLDNVGTYQFPYFRLKVPQNVEGLTQGLMNPESSWVNKDQYRQSLQSLAQSFVTNYNSKFKGKIDVNLQSAIPTTTN